MDIFSKAVDFVSNTAAKVSFKLEQNAPTICLVAGILAIGTGTVLACRASFKLPELIDNTNEKKKEIEARPKENVIIDESGNVAPPELSETDKKDIRDLYVHTAGEIVKLYAPSVISTGIGIALIVHGQMDLISRNAALTAYAMSIQSEFDEYRKNVRLRYGEDVDKQLRFNIPAEGTALPGDIPENGEECTTLTKCTQFSGCNRFLFDETTSANWQKSSIYNYRFVDMCCHTANEMLRARGHIFINEILDLLGMDRVAGGNDMGYIYDPNIEAKIDFGVYQYILNDNDEPSFWIELNHDGDIRARVLK